MKKYAPWLIVIAAFLWSTDALLRQPLTERLSSTVIVFYEHLFGVILLLPVLIKGYKQFLRLGRRDWLAVLFIGVGGSALATIFFTASFSYVSPSVSILLQKVQPIIAILLATVLLKERLGKKFWLGALVAITGAYFISFPDGIPSLAFDEAKGVYFALIAAFFWGASTVMGRYVIKKISFPNLTALRLLVALIFITILMTTQRQLGDLGSISGSDIRSLLLITLFPGTGALLLYYWGLKYTKASVATIAELFFPFSAVILNWIFLGETLVLVQIIGSLVLVAGIYQVQKSNRMNNQPNAPPPVEEISAS
ncbi:DMT family transporter [Patescibacteria group bacterium]|nr:DMT family transporter [Patescibacteria group bacterium]